MTKRVIIEGQSYIVCNPDANLQRSSIIKDVVDKNGMVLLNETTSQLTIRRPRKDRVYIWYRHPSATGDVTYEAIPDNTSFEKAWDILCSIIERTPGGTLVVNDLDIRRQCHSVDPSLQMLWFENIRPRILRKLGFYGNTATPEFIW